MREKNMFNRLSVSVLLNSLFGLMATTIVVLLALGGWESWGRLKATNQIVNNAEASIHLFAALHNMRSDRSNTNRELTSEKTGSLSQNLRNLRAAEYAGLQGATKALKLVEFPAGSTAVSDFEQNMRKMIALQQETEAALSQPKAQRRAGLADEFVKHANAFIEQLEALSSQMVQLVKLKDAYVDQLMHLKDLTWAMRQNAGDAAVLVSNSLAGIVAPDAIMKFQVNLGRAKNVFALVEEFTVGLPLPASFKEAMQGAKSGVFGDEHTGKQLSILKAVVAGEKVNVDVATWSPISIGRQGVIQEAAEIALRTTKDYAADQYARAQRNLLLQLGLLALALAIAGTVVLVIARRITNPLLTVRDVMVRIASGDFNASLSKTNREDEIGQIISSVNEMVAQVRSTVGNIKTSAREVTNASAEISTSTTDLSQRTEEQAASLEETSASMEEISATVKKNAENAQHASESASATRDVAARGGQVVAKAVEAMAKIEDSSRKISDIIGVIDEIARQTNLLALNAAVEAARAGDAGRGFAVVASEVRSLAQRSSQAAKDIKDLITNSNGQVKDGVDLVNRAGSALTEIVDSIKQVADIVADIATASSEQATGLDQINKALTQMDGVTQQNSALVEENAATAKTLEHQAKAMDDQVAFFQIDAAEGESHAVTAVRGHPAAKRPTPRRAA
jgi:methyl-accepting chemotaxis protein